MKILTEDELKRAVIYERPASEKRESIFDTPSQSPAPINEETLESLLSQMNNPVAVQKEILAKCKYLLDLQMEQDLEVLGKLSADTRKWINEFNNTLTNLQKSLYGEKSTVEIKVSHAMIAQKIREHSQIVDVSESKGKSKKR